MCGLFDRFPRLKIILGHMGEGIPFWLQRIDNRYLLQVKIGALEKLPRLPSEYFKDNFVITTSGVTHHGVLRLMHEVLGPDRILFAADYPYVGHRRGRRLHGHRAADRRGSPKDLRAERHEASPAVTVSLAVTVSFGTAH